MAFLDDVDRTLSQLGQVRLTRCMCIWRSWMKQNNMIMHWMNMI